MPDESVAPKEIPASPILVELINLRLNQLIKQGQKEAGLAETANLDLQRGVWIIPST